MFERRGQPMISRAEFARRVARFAAIGLAIVVGSWAVGACGYHFLQGLGWLDAVLNAAMILGGMGPVNEITRSAAKVFASFYALYSGLVLIAVAGLLVVPVFHRFIHHFHIDLEDDDTERA
jgi:hypothetical protein